MSQWLVRAYPSNKLLLSAGELLLFLEIMFSFVDLCMFDNAVICHKLNGAGVPGDCTTRWNLK